MKPKLLLNLPNDTEEMRTAIAALEEMGVRPKRTSQYQIKVGELNFWPGRGTITKDGHPSLSNRGLDAFLEMIPKRPLTLTVNDSSNRSTNRAPSS